MTIQIPGPLQALASVVVGADWPEADEDALWRCQQAWEQAADAVDAAALLGDDAAARVLSQVDGLVGQAFGSFWGDVAAQDGPFVALAAAMRAQAAVCDETALETERTKLCIIAALTTLALEVAALLASAVVSLGASTAGIPVAQAATQVAVRTVLRELVVRIGQSVLMSVGSEVAVESVQSLAHRRNAFDLSHVGEAAYGGLVDGVAGEATGAAGRRLLGDTAEDAVSSATRGAVEGATASAAGSSATSLALGEDLTWRGVVSSAGGGAVGGSTDGFDAHTEGVASAARTTSAPEPPSTEAPAGTGERAPGEERASGSVAAGRG